MAKSDDKTKDVSASSESQNSDAVASAETLQAPAASDASIAPDKIIPAPLDQVTLVDKDGQIVHTTKAFYEKQKASFELTGFKLKE